eukprot:IDg15608t1
MGILWKRVTKQQAQFTGLRLNSNNKAASHEREEPGATGKRLERSDCMHQLERMLWQAVCQYCPYLWAVCLCQEPQDV